MLPGLPWCVGSGTEGQFAGVYNEAAPVIVSNPPESGTIHHYDIKAVWGSQERLRVWELWVGAGPPYEENSSKGKMPRTTKTFEAINPLLGPSPGLVTNSNLVCWLFTIKDRCKKVAFSTNAQSRFDSAVNDSILRPPRLVRHTWRCPCISVVPEATHEASQVPLQGAISLKGP